MITSRFYNLNTALFYITRIFNLFSILVLIYKVIPGSLSIVSIILYLAIIYHSVISLVASLNSSIVFNLNKLLNLHLIIKAFG